MTRHWRPLLPGEIDLSGEHAGDAGDLFLLVHAVVARGVGLEVEGHLKWERSVSTYVKKKRRHGACYWVKNEMKTLTFRDTLVMMDRRSLKFPSFCWWGTTYKSDSVTGDTGPPQTRIRDWCFSKNRNQGWCYRRSGSQHGWGSCSSGRWSPSG